MNSPKKKNCIVILNQLDLQKDSVCLSAVRVFFYTGKDFPSYSEHRDTEEPDDNKPNPR